MAQHATKQGTQALIRKFPEMPYRSLGSSGLQVTPAGFGSYRVHITSDQQQQALRRALSQGINLIDTSSNYGDGGSEELIGAVVKSMIAENQLTREQLVVVSKAGYIQGQNLKVVADRERSGNPFPEVVSINTGLGHCIHPDYLEDQLQRSLRRLQMKTVDFFLLHNPEYYFYEAEKKGLNPAEARDEFYRRIEQAFMGLELLADAGQIVYYGVSANSLPLTPDDTHYVDIRRLWEIAESLRPDHRFRMVQFPMNLLEPQAAINHSADKRQTILQFTREKNLAVLTNRPLNAFYKDQLQRLISVQSAPFDASRMEKTLTEVVRLEEEFAGTIIHQVKLENTVRERLAGLFATGSYLARHYKNMATYWSWMGQHAHFISEQVSYAVQQVNEAPQNSRQVIDWLDAYVRVFNEVMDMLTACYGKQAELFSKEILQRLFAGKGNSGNLTRVALHALWQTPGISSVLIGMRRPDYVDEVAGELMTENDLKIPDWIEIYRRLQRLG